MTKKYLNIIERKIEKLSGGNKEYEALLKKAFFADNEIGSAVVEGEKQKESELNNLIAEINKLKNKITWLETEKGVLKRDLETQTEALQIEVDGLYNEREIWFKEQQKYREIAKSQQE